MEPFDPHDDPCQGLCNNFYFSTPYVPEPTGSIPQIPGPQVPPRLGDGQDRVLSVSGKKKCSHCKDELGRKKRSIDCWFVGISD